MDARQILINARKLIAKQENWTRGQFYDVRGGTRSVCSVGAICLADTGVFGDIRPFSPAARTAFHALAEAMGVDPYRVGIFNDTHAHAQVLRAFDKAIAALTKPTDIAVFENMLTSAPADETV